MKYNPTMHGAADYNKYVMVSNADYDTFTQETSAIDPHRQGKFAQLVYNVNGISGGGGSPVITGDVHIGAVEIKDADNDVHTNVISGGTYNGMATYILNELGEPISTFGSSPIASTTTPNPVGDGDEVNLWVDEYGRQVGFGANLSLNAVDVNVINTATTMRLGPLVNLSLGVGAIGAGPTVDVSNYHNITIHIQSSGVTAGSITVQIEHSLDGMNFVPISVNNIATVGDVEYTFSNQAYRYIRTNVPSFTTGYNGAIQTIIYAGN